MDFCPKKWIFGTFLLFKVIIFLKAIHPHHLSFRSLFIFYDFLEQCSVYVIRNKRPLRFYPYQSAFFNFFFISYFYFFIVFFEKTVNIAVVENVKGNVWIKTFSQASLVLPCLTISGGKREILSVPNLDQKSQKTRFYSQKHISHSGPSSSHHNWCI